MNQDQKQILKLLVGLLDTKRSHGEAFESESDSESSEEENLRTVMKRQKIDTDMEKQIHEIVDSRLKKYGLIGQSKSKHSENNNKNQQDAEKDDEIYVDKVIKAPRTRNQRRMAQDYKNTLVEPEVKRSPSVDDLIQKVISTEEYQIPSKFNIDKILKRPLHKKLEMIKAHQSNKFQKFTPEQIWFIICPQTQKTINLMRYHSKLKYFKNHTLFANCKNLDWLTDFKYLLEHYNIPIQLFDNKTQNSKQNASKKEQQKEDQFPVESVDQLIDKVAEQRHISKPNVASRVQTAGTNSDSKSDQNMIQIISDDEAGNDKTNKSSKSVSETVSTSSNVTFGYKNIKKARPTKKERESTEDDIFAKYAHLTFSKDQ